MTNFTRIERISVDRGWLDAQLAEIRAWTIRDDTINKSISAYLLTGAEMLRDAGQLEQSFLLLLYIRLNLETASSAYLKGALTDVYDEIQRLAIEQLNISNS